MRELTTLSEAPQAHRFADYLLALDIEARVDATPDGWIVWILDEDLLPRAREELQAFLIDPQHVRFKATAPKQEEVAEEDEEPIEPETAAPADPAYPVFNVRLTAQLLLVSTIVTVVASGFNADNSQVWDELLIARPDAQGILPRGLPEVRQGQVWRLVTPIFLHIGALHLLGNMLWLHLLGKQVEQRSGSLKFAGLVLLFALASNLGQYVVPALVLDGDKLQIPPPHAFGGMSGVVFGLFGYVWLKSTFQSDSGLYIAPNSVILMLGWFVLCTTGLVGNIANTAHGVGLMAGMIAGYASAWWHGWGPVEPDEPT